MNPTFAEHSTPDVDTIVTGLLGIGAVEIRPTSPFTWSSGWQSPIYCDNRLILGYPVLRDLVIESFEAVLRTQMPFVELIAGTSTAGIPHASILADRFQLPTVYVRSEAKAHGQGRQIEGHFRSGMKAVVVEDTLSTGKSSYEAVRALQQAGVDVLAVLTILSYDFDVAMQKMRETGVPVYRLVSYHDLVRVAVAVGVIPETEVDLLMKWREAPDSFVAAQKIP